MNVVTVADLIRDVVQRVLNEDAKADANFLPSNLLLRWIGDAYQELARRTHCLTAQHTGNLLAQASHTAPSGILDRMIWHKDALRVKVGADWYPLKERDWAYVRGLYSDLDDLDGAEVPDSWAWDERSATPAILILPPPLTAVASGFILDYVLDPGPITRLYDDDTATASVTNGSATVTFAASIEGLLEVGDTFGVKSSATALPTRWYKVATVTDTLHVELSETYAGVTNAAALFTLSQVSLIEWKRPGLVNYAPSEYVLARYWQSRSEGDQWLRYRQAFDLEVARINKAISLRPGLAMQGANAYNQFPAHRRL